MKKKLMALFLAMVMVMGLCVTAFADEGDEGGETTPTQPTVEAQQDEQPKVYKTYQVNNGTAPAETFTFKFTAESYKNGDGDTVADAMIPTIDNATISFDAIDTTETKSAELNIDANQYELGVYTYKVEEIAGSTAGVTYDSTPLYLVLTILRDENSGKHFVAAMHYETADGSKLGSDGAIVNEYDAGSLSVTKQITGNMADMTKKFAFTITFTAPTGKTVNSTITVTNPDASTENLTFDAEGTLTYTIDLGDDNTVTFTNLPAGVTYVVSEEAENYTASQNNVEGNIEANDADTVEITNDLNNGTIDTGITMDSLPYIVLLALVVVAGVVFFSKKRMAREN